MTCLVNLINTKIPVTCFLVLSILTISIIGLYKKRVFGFFYLHPYDIIHHKQYYRLLTADFVHNDVIHLFLNLLMLSVFCADLETTLNSRSIYGSLQLLEIFMISQIFANFIFTIRHRNEFGYSSAGCSASVMGCVFAFMITDPFGSAIKFALIGGIENIYTGIIYISALFYYQWKRKNEMINHEIHFYGAVGGVIGAFLVIPWLSIKMPG
jgi:membrane associated rhomboid family serine protease